MRNIYRDGLPAEKAILLGANVLLRPILSREFLGDVGLILPAAQQTQRKDARAAIAFQVLAIGPDVKSKELLPGRVCIVSEAALDFADPEGSHLICEEQDIRVVFRLEDLE
jgi:hypothetical protein